MRFLGASFMLFSEKIVTLHPENQHFEFVRLFFAPLPSACRMSFCKSIKLIYTNII